MHPLLAVMVHPALTARPVVTGGGLASLLANHWLDLLLISLLLIDLVVGYRNGLAFQVLRYTGLAAGVVLGAWVAARAATALGVQSPVGRVIVAAGVFVALIIVGQSIGLRLGLRARAALGPRSVFSRLDALAGAGLGLLVGLLVIWFLGLTLARGPVPQLSRAIANSAVLRGIDDVAPPPPAVLSEIQGLLDRTPFPAPFAGVEPLFGGGPPPPVHGTPGEVRAVRETVQVESQGCGGLVFGSGFPVAPGLVVTNAHVVGGTTGHRVALPGAGSAPATVVWFDPERDLALLRVSRLGLTPLPVATAGPPPITAVVAGYPGGGPEQVVGARVVDEVTAVGRDIYSANLVTRPIEVLRAVVRPGNSGGPVVDARGQVIGIVFAASTIDPTIGYALSTVELRQVLAAAGPASRPVGVGACPA